MTDELRSAMVPAHTLRRALGIAHGFAGDGRFDAVYMEFSDGPDVDVLASDSIRLVRVPLLLAAPAHAGTVVLENAEIGAVLAFLTVAGASEVMMAFGETYVGFTHGNRKLMVSRLKNEPLPWRERVAARHVPGPHLMVDLAQMRAALAPFSFGGVVLHLPAGDGQPMRIYEETGGESEVWLMPMTNSMPGVMNQKHAEVPIDTAE